MELRSSRARRADWSSVRDSDGDQVGHATPAVAVDAGGQDGEAQSPGALWAQGLEEGEDGLARRPIAAAATGLVGGFDVMIGLSVIMFGPRITPSATRRRGESARCGVPHDSLCAEPGGGVASEGRYRAEHG